MKKVAVLQSNYIPWKGYFDIIHDVDLFVFYDDVQYTKRDWRSRNVVPAKDKLIWLTVPVITKGSYNQLIYEAKISSFEKWQKEHCNTLLHIYSKAPYFRKYSEFLRHVYLEKEWTYLYELNRYMITSISKEFLGITTQFGDSRNYETQGVKHEKLLRLVEATGADVYISGPAAKNYLIEQDYLAAGIKVIWKDYSGYPEYKQLITPYNGNVSILDLLFNTGDEAPYYIWGWREKNGRFYGG